MDSYKAIYSAIADKLAFVDFSDAVRSAFSTANEYLSEAANEALRPSVLFRPKLSKDGDQWCALYGEDLQIGVAGFGDTADQAMRAFDVAWTKEGGL